MWAGRVFQAEDTEIASHYVRKYTHWGVRVELVRSAHAGQDTPSILPRIGSGMSKKPS